MKIKSLIGLMFGLVLILSSCDSAAVQIPDDLSDNDQGAPDVAHDQGTPDVEHDQAAPDVEPKSSAKDILTFSIADVSGTIRGSNIAVIVPAGTDVSALAPTIEVSPGASVSPASGEEMDFSIADFVFYTVTAEEGTTRDYIVTVKVAEAPQSDLSGNATISADSPLEVVVLDTSSPLSPSGSGLGATGDGLPPEGSGLLPTPGGIIPTGIGNPASGTAASVVDLTSLTSIINISLAYSGPEALEYCSANSPFQLLSCTIDDPIITMTRRSLLYYMGSDTTVDLSVGVGKSGYNSKESNALPAIKHKITQILNLPVNCRSGFTVFNNALYFSAGSSRLYKYDGTSITQISNINTAPGGTDDPAYLTVFNNELYFSANSPLGQKLYMYNGTSITQISDINSGGADSPAYLTVFNNELYFSANSSLGQKLYMYNGTSITQISSIGSSDDPRYLTVFNNDLYFNAGGPTSKLYKYDGINITQISNTYTGPAGDNPEFLTVFNGALYFKANADSTIARLYKYDGASSITQISNFLPSGDNPGNLTVFNGALYFSAVSNSPLLKLYKYDPAGAGSIKQISNIITGPPGDNPHHLTVFDNALYFLSNPSNGGSADTLSKYDGTRIIHLSKIPGTGALTVFNNTLYFGVLSPTGGSIPGGLFKFE